MSKLLLKSCDNMICFDSTHLICPIPRCCYLLHSNITIKLYKCPIDCRDAKNHIYCPGCYNMLHYNLID